MITVTLGTIPYQFNRAIYWVSQLLEEEVISEPVFVQYGFSDVTAIQQHPLVKVAPMLELKEMTSLIQNSRLIISHAGQGSTRSLIAAGARFMLLPRLAKYREHVDNHQLLFSQTVAPMGVRYCLGLEELKQAVLHPPEVVDPRFLQAPKLVDHLLKAYPPTLNFSTPQVSTSHSVHTEVLRKEGYSISQMANLKENRE